jgi:hypothetical protein
MSVDFSEVVIAAVASLFDDSADDLRRVWMQGDTRTPPLEDSQTVSSNDVETSNEGIVVSCLIYRWRNSLQDTTCYGTNRSC